MSKYNAQNERLKHRYFQFLEQAKGRDDATIDGVAAALRRFEEHTRFKDFRTFRPEQAISFKTHLSNETNPRTRQPLSKATLHQTVNALKSFFQWLAAEPGYRSRITYSHADYFGLSEKKPALRRPSVAALCRAWNKSITFCIKCPAQLTSRSVTERFLRS